MYKKTIIIKMLARTYESAFKKLKAITTDNGWGMPSVYAVFVNGYKYSFTFEVAAKAEDHFTTEAYEID